MCCCCWKQLLKATSPGKLLAGGPCGSNSQAPGELSPVGAGAQSDGLSEAVPMVSGMYMLLYSSSFSVHVKRDRKGL